MKRLCLKAREILVEEANVQVVDSPVTVSDVTLQWPSLFRFLCALSACPSGDFTVFFCKRVSSYTNSADMWRYSWTVLRYAGALCCRRLVP